MHTRAEPMLERAARVLASERDEPHLWRHYVEQAQAMLIAMRDPTDAMRDGLPRGYRPGSHSAREIWNGLINGALAEWRAAAYLAARLKHEGRAAPPSIEDRHPQI